MSSGLSLASSAERKREIRLSGRLAAIAPVALGLVVLAACLFLMLWRPTWRLLTGIELRTREEGRSFFGWSIREVEVWVP